MKRNEQFEDSSDNKRIKLDNAEAEQQMLNNVTPLFNMPYDEQVRYSNKLFKSDIYTIRNMRK